MTPLVDLNRRPGSGSTFAAWAVVLCACVASAPRVHAQIELNTTTATMLAKAPADECYTALGQNVPGDFPPCSAGQLLKVSQSYVWSQVDTGDDVWFGTTANALCTTEGAFSQSDTGITPYQTPSWACEYGDSPYSPPLPAALGDFRPPRIYVYNKASAVLTDITPRGSTGSSDRLLNQTSGLRAAVVAGNYVIFAGPKLTGGLAFFAYNIQSKQWIAKGELAGYRNIRSFLNVGGVIYAGVGTAQGGGVLRYTGSFATIPPPAPGDGAGTCPACFSFNTVALLDSDAAGLAMHNGRMYVSTWPARGLGGLYMGPPVPAGGYTVAGARQWSKVWDARQYEPDPAVATSYAGGALHSFGGYLYWGTINVPFASYQAWVAVHGTPPTQEQAAEVVAFTFRPAVLFRSPGFDTGTPHVDLLYGATQLYAYTPPPGGGPEGTWALTPNKMPAGSTSPLYGVSGINNTFNIYIWSMAVWQNKLWVGTLDWSWLLAQMAEIIPLPPPPPVLHGADLFYFNDANSAAVAEDRNGLGNVTSYGIRNLLPSGDSMYVGMANSANLLGDPENPPNGGWELILLQPE